MIIHKGTFDKDTGTFLHETFEAEYEDGVYRGNCILISEHLMDRVHDESRDTLVAYSKDPTVVRVLLTDAFNAHVLRITTKLQDMKRRLSTFQDDCR